MDDGLPHPLQHDAEVDATDTAEMRVAVSRGGSEHFVEGRRSYVRYRDLEVREASRGRFGGTVARGTGEPIEPTGWHYHVCEAQMTYVLRGWVDFEFGDGDSTRVEAGDAVFIPGGVRHAERGASPDIEVLEYTVPGEIETVACDGPGPAVAVTLSTNAASTA